MTNAQSRATTSEQAVALLRDLFDAAVAAAQPQRVIGEFLPEPVGGRTVVIGAGKGSAAMARAFETAWHDAGRGKLEGMVVTQYGYREPCRDIEVVEAGHPVPDDNSLLAAQRILALARELGPDDQLVALISGGGSALLCLPAGGLRLADKQTLNDTLLKSGASIAEMNCVRKHFSAIKSGRLAAAAHPARVHTLVLSDIPGDILHLVASGPTIADATDRHQARQIVTRYRMALPEALMRWLDNPDCSAPMPDDPRLGAAQCHVIGSAQVSLEAAAAQARQNGYDVHILSDRVEGEARDAGRVHAALALQIRDRGQPFSAPCLLLSGGETTVTVRAKGKGGRNSEFLLGFALDIAGRDGIYALAADTDGRDGTEDNAGAICDGTTAARIRAAGADPRSLLAGNDAWSAFDAAQSLLVTGPTRTNVNDFRAVLII